MYIYQNPYLLTFCIINIYKVFQIDYTTILYIKNQRIGFSKLILDKIDTKIMHLFL
jgi:hypothetical protein